MARRRCVATKAQIARAILAARETGAGDVTVDETGIHISPVPAEIIKEKPEMVPEWELSDAPHRVLKTPGTD
jgi:hypothetical protein